MEPEALFKKSVLSGGPPVHFLNLCMAISEKLSFERASFSYGEKILKDTMKILGSKIRATDTASERCAMPNRQ